ncbi:MULTISPECIES: hypothetical protein [unclassified Microbacterium]|uniref:hypothetical protein n=1 Tax=unclassified Microbacterium TaxID=2609290 RepID=UPI003018B566
MYEHPYLSRQITRFEREQMERAAAQRRLLIEHADQVRLRPEGALRRMVRRLSGATGARPAASRTDSVCDATAAHAR